MGLLLEDDLMANLQDLEAQEETKGFIEQEDIDRVTHCLMKILPRLVRQENIRDNLVFDKT